MPDVLMLWGGLLHRKRAKAHEYAVAGNPLYDFDSTNVRQGQSVAGIAYAMSRGAAAGRAELLAKKRHIDRLQNPAKLRRFRIGGRIRGG